MGRSSSRGQAGPRGHPSVLTMGRRGRSPTRGRPGDGEGGDTHGKERLLCPQKLMWTKRTGDVRLPSPYGQETVANLQEQGMMVPGAAAWGGGQGRPQDRASCQPNGFPCRAWRSPGTRAPLFLPQSPSWNEDVQLFRDARPTIACRTTGTGFPAWRVHTRRRHHTPGSRRRPVQGSTWRDPTHHLL